MVLFLFFPLVIIVTNLAKITSFQPKAGSKPSTPPGYGTKTLPLAPASTATIPGILNILNLKLSLPYILGQNRLLFAIGGYSYELDATADKTDYQIDLRAASFPLGKELDLSMGGQFLLIRKAKFTPKAETTVLDLGELAVGDLNNDNRINADDRSTLLSSVGRSNGGDINRDRVTNSFDWAILLRYMGKGGQ